MKINVAGKAIPCRPLMGAALRYKELTGSEFSEMSTESLTSACQYAYCCAQSACARDNVPFEMTLQEFADSIDIVDLADWLNEFAEYIPKKKAAQAKVPQAKK